MAAQNVLGQADGLPALRKSKPFVVVALVKTGVAMSTYQKGVKEGLRMAAMILMNPQKWISEFKTYEDEIKVLLTARDALVSLQQPETKKDGKDGP